MDRRSVGDKTFLRSVVEVRSMVDGRDVALGSSKDGRLPSVEMRVKVDDRDRTVDGVDRSKNGENDSMITSERDDTRSDFASESGCESGFHRIRFAAAEVANERDSVNISMHELLVCEIENVS